MSFLYPGEYIDSTYSIDFDKLYKDGYRGVIFDIDNTLVTHGSPADERAIALFKHLKELWFFVPCALKQQRAACEELC